MNNGAIQKMKYFQEVNVLWLYKRNSKAFKIQIKISIFLAIYFLLL